MSYLYFHFCGNMWQHNHRSLLSSRQNRPATFWFSVQKQLFSNSSTKKVLSAFKINIEWLVHCAQAQNFLC